MLRYQMRNQIPMIMANVKQTWLPTIAWSAFKDVIFYRQSDYFKPKIVKLKSKNRLGLLSKRSKKQIMISKVFQII
jgi:hypothetical protein